MKTTISVLMSIYNQGNYLAQALESLTKQTYPTHEYIIINDGSTDKTSEILARYSLPGKVIFHPTSLGLARSLNEGLLHATGEYVARMDADDIAEPERFAKQVKYLQLHPQVAACGTSATLMNQSGEEIGKKKFPTNPQTIKKIIMRYNPLIHPTVMIRSQILREVGEYDESLNGAEDYDLWLRLASRYQLSNLKEPLLTYRQNPQGVSWSQTKKVEWQAIRARWKALTRYGYPWWQSLFMVKPLLSFLLPTQIKKTWFHIS